MCPLFGEAMRETAVNLRLGLELGERKAHLGENAHPADIPAGKLDPDAIFSAILAPGLRRGSVAISRHRLTTRSRPVYSLGEFITHGPTAGEDLTAPRGSHQLRSGVPEGERRSAPD